MRPLGVILIELLASLADLLDDQKTLVALDDALNLRLLVAGRDDEPVTLPENPLVLGRPQLDLLEACGLSALAVERHRAVNSVKPGAVLDLLVDFTHDLLVSSRSLRKSHIWIIPRSPALSCALGAHS